MKPLTKEKRDKFKKIFGVELEGFWHPILGFDVTKFDSFLKVPGGTSMREFISNNYGKLAVNLILGFLR